MNIQPGRIQKTRSARPAKKSNLGATIFTVAKFSFLLIVVAMLVNTYIYLNQKITETERSIRKTQRELVSVEREIAQLRIRREELSAWPHIRTMIARFDLKLRAPLPGQVGRMELLGREEAARVPFIGATRQASNPVVRTAAGAARN